LSNVPPTSAATSEVDGRSHVLVGFEERQDRESEGILHASARSKTLAAGDLLRLLAAGLGVLRTGAPDTAVRHRTLIATIGWSHDLLTPDERISVAGPVY
jgi:predicted ATPase